MHGMFWRFPKGFRSTNTAGIRPRSTYLKVIGDFCKWQDRIVLGCDDTAKNEFLNKRKAKGEIPGPQSQSNLWFIEPQQLDQLGRSLDAARSGCRTMSQPMSRAICSCSPVLNVGDCSWLTRERSRGRSCWNTISRERLPDARAGDHGACSQFAVGGPLERTASWLGPREVQPAAGKGDRLVHRLQCRSAHGAVRSDLQRHRHTRRAGRHGRLGPGSWREQTHAALCRTGALREWPARDWTLRTRRSPQAQPRGGRNCSQLPEAARRDSGGSADS